MTKVNYFSQKSSPVKKSATGSVESGLKRACDACRSRHIKCDAESPCSNCTKRDRVCVYSTPKKRGPRPGSVRQSRDNGRRVIYKQKKKVMSLLKETAVDAAMTAFRRQHSLCPSTVPTLDDLSCASSEVRLPSEALFSSIVAVGAFYRNDWDTHARYLDRAQKLLGKLAGSTSTSVVETLVLVAEVYLARERYDKALKLVKQALKASANVTNNVRLLSRIYQLVVRLEQREDLRSSAFEFALKLNDLTHRDLVMLYTSYVAGELCYNHTQHLPQLLRILSQAKALLGLEDTSRASLILNLQILALLAEISLRSGELWTALAYANQAYGLFKALQGHFCFGNVLRIICQTFLAVQPGAGQTQAACSEYMEISFQWGCSTDVLFDLVVCSAKSHPTSPLLIVPSPVQDEVVSSPNNSEHVFAFPTSPISDAEIERASCSPEVPLPIRLDAVQSQSPFVPIQELAC